MGFPAGFRAAPVASMAPCPGTLRYAVRAQMGHKSMGYIIGIQLKHHLNPNLLLWSYHRNGCCNSFCINAFLATAGCHARGLPRGKAG